MLCKNANNYNKLYKSICAYEIRSKIIWSVFPVIQLARVTVACGESNYFKFKIKWHAFIEWLLSEKKREIFIKKISDIGATDVLIVYSSMKPSWYPAIEDLGEKLAECRVECCIIGVGKIKKLNSLLIDTNGNEKKDNYHEYAHGICSRYDKIYIILKSLLATFFIAVISFTTRHAWILIKRLPFYFLEFIESYKRLKVAHFIIKNLKPKVVITNGEHLPICSEIMYTAKKYGSHVVWFYNEWPQSGFIPQISQEVWTWNETSKKAIEQVIPKKNKIDVKTVGIAESEYTANIYQDSGLSKEFEWMHHTRSNIFLFLLDYNGNSERGNEPIARMSFEILKMTAENCSNWEFVIKPRPFQSNMAIPGEEVIKNQSNCRILRTKCSIAPLIDIKNVKVVAGCQSSGLLTSAAKNKISVRLMIPGADMPLPYIDDVCTKVMTSENLINLLRNIENGYCSEDIVNREKYFPYNGKVVERMRDLALEKL